jgi:hypothetical protein
MACQQAKLLNNLKRNMAELLHITPQLSGMPTRGSCPKKMEPVGNISATTYKLLCHAYQSFVPNKQLNSCACDNKWPN